MKKFLFSQLCVLSLLTLMSVQAQSQADQNRPKPKTRATREIGQPENPQPQPGKTSAAPSVASPPQASNRRRKVMVTDFDARGIPHWWGNWDVGSLFANAMVTRLSSTGSYDVVERERMKAIIEEQNLSQDERFRQDKVTRIGQLLGADYVVFGYLTNFARKKSNKLLYNEYSALISFSVRLVDVSSGTVVKSSEIDYASNKDHKVVMSGDNTFNPNDPDFLQSLFGKAINESVGQAVEKLTGEAGSGVSQPAVASQKNFTGPTVAPAPANDGRLHGSIAAVDGDNVIINRGQAQGVKVGEIFEVTRGGITDPETGKILRAKVIAEVRITNVDDGSADGAIVSQKEKVVAKDSVVLKTAKP